MSPEVDLVVLSRDDSPLDPRVERGIRTQQGVNVALHRVVGRVRADDCCRWDAIVRGRNEGKSRGASPWLMFLDDDVALEPTCIAELVGALDRRPAFGALAADYRGESRRGHVAWHVSMGCTLFRRAALDQIRFAWRNNRCECQCCCDSLRRLHWGIDYCDQARAIHLPKRRPETTAQADGETPAGPPAPRIATGIVMTAFNRRHARAFREQFVCSLRATANKERVMTLALGLNEIERVRLRRLAGVTPVFRPDDGRRVARQRLLGFYGILRKLPRDAIVAYWDAGDVIFQSKIQPLWDLASTQPGKLLVAREPMTHPESPTIKQWTRGIIDRAARRRVRKLLYPRPWLNGGFIAGAAGELARYFRTVAHWYDMPKLAGSGNLGDQLALNVYCHSHPDRWHEAPESWNYCLCRRDLRTVYRRRDGGYVDIRGVPIHVVHGNGGRLGRVRFR